MTEPSPTYRVTVYFYEGAPQVFHGVHNVCVDSNPNNGRGLHISGPNTTAYFVPGSFSGYTRETETIKPEIAKANDSWGFDDFSAFPVVGEGSPHRSTRSADNLKGPWEINQKNVNLPPSGYAKGGFIPYFDTKEAEDRCETWWSLREDLNPNPPEEETATPDFVQRILDQLDPAVFADLFKDLFKPPTD